MLRLLVALLPTLYSALRSRRDLVVETTLAVSVAAPQVVTRHSPKFQKP